MLFLRMRDIYLLYITSHDNAARFECSKVYEAEAVVSDAHRTLYYCRCPAHYFDSCFCCRILKEKELTYKCTPCRQSPASARFVWHNGPPCDFGVGNGKCWEGWETSLRYTYRDYVTFDFFLLPLVIIVLRKRSQPYYKWFCEIIFLH